MSARKTFRVRLVREEPAKKVWQELRGAEVMNYAAVKGYDGAWRLYSKLGTRKAEAALGDLMRAFKDLESLCTFLGVPVIGE